MSAALAAQSALALQRPIQTLSVGCCVAMAMAMLPAAYRGELFAWHPLMFTLGFIGFMTEVGSVHDGSLACLKSDNEGRQWTRSWHGLARGLKGDRRMARHAPPCTGCTPVAELDCMPARFPSPAQVNIPPT